MKYLLSISLLLSLFVNAQTGRGTRLSNAANVDTVSFVGKNIVFIGDSYTFGTAATSNANRYSTLFTTSRGGVEVNLGIGGQRLQAGSVCTGTWPLFDKTTIPTYTTSYAILFIDLGVNDIGLNTSGGAVPLTSSAYQLTLDTVVAYAIQIKGWPNNRIVLGTPFWYTGYSFYNSLTGCGHTEADVTRHEAYVAAVIAVATDRRCTIADVYTSVKNNPSKTSFLYTDSLHYNDTGHAAISAFLNTLTFYN